MPGHWEGHLIIGRNGAACEATLVERMCGFTALLVLPSKHAEPTTDAVVEYFTGLPEMMQRTLVRDRGTEMPHHHKATLATTMPVCFADPHAPRQRRLDTTLLRTEVPEECRARTRNNGAARVHRMDVPHFREHEDLHRTADRILRVIVRASPSPLKG